MTCITHIFNKAASLQAAGHTDSQDTFDISGSAFALCTEAALTPQDGLSYCSFGQIIRWFHPHIIHKCPQIMLLVDYATTPSGQSLAAVGSFFQQGFHTLSQRFHTVLKRLPQQRAVPYPFTQMQNLFGQYEQFASESAHRSFGLRQRLKITFEMCPTQLSQACKAIVTAPAVTVKSAGKITQQLLGRRLPASGLDHKNRSAGAAQGPQPALKAIASRPAGFIGMGRLLHLDMVRYLLIRTFQRLGQLGFTMTQAAQAHWHGKDLVHHRQGFALAGIQHPGQYADDGQHAGTEMLTFDRIGQGTVYIGSAVPALKYVLDIFHDLRLDGRYIDNLMTQRFLASLFDMFAAACASVRFKMNMLFNKLLWQQRSQMRRMAVLGPAFFTPMHWQFDRHSGWIGRGRLGRILRVLAQKPLKLFDMFFQRRDSLFQFDNLVLELFYIYVFVHTVIIGQRKPFTGIISTNQI